MMTLYDFLVLPWQAFARLKIDYEAKAALDHSFNLMKPCSNQHKARFINNNQPIIDINDAGVVIVCPLCSQFIQKWVFSVICIF